MCTYVFWGCVPRHDMYVLRKAFGHSPFISSPVSAGAVWNTPHDLHALWNATLQTRLSAREYAQQHGSLNMLPSSNQLQISGWQ